MPPMSPKPNPPQLLPLPLLAALFAVTAWGLTAPITKVAVTTLDPLAVAVLRTVLAGIVTVPLALVLGLRLPSRREHWLFLCLSACCGFVLFPLLFSLGLRWTTAARGVLILAAMPVLTGLYVALIDRRRPSGRWAVGCMLALAGEALLILARGGGQAGEGQLLGDALVVLSALAASFGYVAGGKLQQQGYSPWATTLWGVGLATPFVAPILLFVGFDARPGASALLGWGSTIYLALVSTVIAYVAWYWALGKGGIARMATIQFLQPVTGVIVAVLWLGEAFTATMLAASVAIVAGVVIVQRR
ncbi:MAG: DMT family transporter [Rhodospirillales bacterium]|nr:DMT family transporter [Rhodospirillales bacterium]